MVERRQIRKAEVLAEALALLESGDELSLRRLAVNLGVQAPSLYHYFGNKKVLQQALVKEGNRLLLEDMREAVGRKKKKSAFVAVAVAYLGFARRRSVLYSFMMRDFEIHEEASTEQALWRMMLKAVSDVSGVPDDISTAVAVWSFLHGFADLERSGRFGAAGPKYGFETGMEAFMQFCES